MEEVIKSEFSGDIKNALLTVGKLLQSFQIQCTLKMYLFYFDTFSKNIYIYGQYWDFCFQNFTPIFMFRSSVVRPPLKIWKLMGHKHNMSYFRLPQRKIQNIF